MSRSFHVKIYQLGTKDGRITQALHTGLTAFTLNMKKGNSLKPCQKSKLHNIEEPEPVAQENKHKRTANEVRMPHFHLLYITQAFSLSWELPLLAFF